MVPMRKIPLLCCAAVARVCKQRLRAGFQTKGFPEDNITKSGMYLRILWRDFVKPPTEKPFALESNFLVRLCFFVTKGYRHTVTTNALDLEGWAVGVAALWGYSLSVDECLGAILPSCP